MGNSDATKSHLRSAFPLHMEDIEPIRDGSLKKSDIIYNTATGYCFYATEDDVKTIKPDTFPNHKHFVKLIPLF